MSLALFLAACSNKPITSHSTGIWDHYIIYNCSQFIIWLSKHFGGYGMGIIIFTIIIRIILLPLMFYQTKTMMKTQELAPQLKAIQKKYSSRDRESMQKQELIHGLRCFRYWFSYQLCGLFIKQSGGPQPYGMELSCGFS